MKSDQDVLPIANFLSPCACVCGLFCFLFAGGEKPTGFGAFAAAGGAGGGFGGFSKAAAVGADATKLETETSEKPSGEEGTGTTEENNATKAGAVETQTKEMPKMVSSNSITNKKNKTTTISLVIFSPGLCKQAGRQRVQC